jgi:hypothetical protein
MGASNTTGTIEIDGKTVTYHKLNWKKLREASDAQTLAYYAQVSKAPKALLDAQATTTAQAKGSATGVADTPKEHNYAGYDRDVVFRAGVKSVPGVEKVNTWLDDLDEVDAKRLHKAILDLSLPPLDPAVEDAERKND